MSDDDADPLEAMLVGGPFAIGAPSGALAPHSPASQQQPQQQQPQQQQRQQQQPQQQLAHPQPDQQPSARKHKKKKKKRRQQEQEQQEQSPQQLQERHQQHQRPQQDQQQEPQAPLLGHLLPAAAAAVDRGAVPDEPWQRRHRQPHSPQQRRQQQQRSPAAQQPKSRQERRQQQRQQRRQLPATSSNDDSSDESAQEDEPAPANTSRREERDPPAPRLASLLPAAAIADAIVHRQQQRQQQQQQQRWQPVLTPHQRLQQQQQVEEWGQQRQRQRQQADSDEQPGRKRSRTDAEPAHHNGGSSARRDGGTAVRPVLPLTMSGNANGASAAQLTDGKKKGKFSAEESARVEASIRDYCALHNVSVERLCQDGGHKGEIRGAWHIIAEALPERTVQSVYRHGIRRMHVCRRGPWSDDEIQQLRQLVRVHGPKWRLIETHIGRISEACRDKYRELNPEEHRTGLWDRAEEERLHELLWDFFKVAPDTRLSDLPKTEIPWDFISAQHGTRSRVMCLKKMENIMSAEFQREARARGESRAHTDLRLVEELLETGAEDESEITWAKLSHPIASTRWIRLRSRIPGSAAMSFVAALRECRAGLLDAVHAIDNGDRPRARGKRHKTPQQRVVGSLPGGASDDDDVDSSDEDDYYGDE